MLLKRAILTGVASLLSIGAAYAHATFETKQAKANSYYKAVVRVPHGCDGQPTLKVKVTIPEGMISVRPQPKAGWDLEVKKGDYAHSYMNHGKEIKSGIKELIWTGELDDEYYDEFVFQARMTDKLPVGKTLYVPIVQECADGQVAWIEIPEDGKDPHSYERPAPGIKILAADEAHGHGHGHGHADAHDDHNGDKMDHANHEGHEGHEGHDGHEGHGDHAKHEGHEGHNHDHDHDKGAAVTIGDLTITGATAKATLPGQPVGAGYITIKNNGKHADVLLGGSAGFAGKVEVHEMKMNGDVMKMRALPEGVEIPAGGEIVLKPGGYHLMFMKLNEGLKAGDNEEVTLNFKNAGSAKVNFEVVKMGGHH